MKRKESVLSVLTRLFGLLIAMISSTVVRKECNIRVLLVIIVFLYSNNVFKKSTGSIEKTIFSSNWYILYYSPPMIIVICDENDVP